MDLRAYNCTANMLILKRLAVWLLERLVEGILLGALLGYLLVPNFTGLFSGVWVLAVAVGFVLFTHGYYLTTAFFGVVWRSTRSWVYPAITAALFAIHSHIVFVRGKSDFTPETRAMESPFILCGACIVFACAFTGGRVLNKWVQASASPNPYLSATGITLLLFLLVSSLTFCDRPPMTIAFVHTGFPSISTAKAASWMDGFGVVMDSFGTE